MSKGGRVSYQLGGNLGKNQTEPQEDEMSIGGPGGGTDNIKGSEEGTSLPKDAPMEQSEKPMQVQSTDGPMSKEDFFKQYGDYKGATKGSAAGKAKDAFNEQRQAAYEDYLRDLIGIGTGTGTNTGTGTGTGTGTSQTTGTTASPERQARIAETAKKTQEASEGKVPEAAIIPDAEQVGFQRDSEGNLILDEQGNAIPLKEQEVTTMKETQAVKGTPAEQFLMKKQLQEKLL